MPATSRLNRIRPLLIRAITIVVVTVVVIIGHEVDHRSRLMVGGGRIERLLEYASVEWEVSTALGMTRIRSSNTRALLLHQTIADSILETGLRDERAAHLIASLMLDRGAGGKALFCFVNSRVSLPRIHFYRQFNISALYGNDLSPLLQDEQGLVLWMLSAMYTESLIPPPTLECPCEVSREDGRELLSALWDQWFTN